MTTMDELRIRAEVILEFCRLTETDPDGRGIRWRLTFQFGDGSDVTAGLPIGRDLYRIEVREPPRDPHTVYVSRFLEDANRQVGNAFDTKSQADEHAKLWSGGTVAEYVEVVPPAEWRPWEPTEQHAGDVDPSRAAVGILRQRISKLHDDLHELHAAWNDAERAAGLEPSLEMPLDGNKLLDRIAERALMVADLKATNQRLAGDVDQLREKLANYRDAADKRLPSSAGRVSRTGG